MIQIGEHAEGAAADPATHLVAIGVRNPAGPALLDGRTGAITARVPPPGTCAITARVPPPGTCATCDSPPRADRSLAPARHPGR